MPPVCACIKIFKGFLMFRHMAFMVAKRLAAVNGNCRNIRNPLNVFMLHSGRHWVHVAYYIMKIVARVDGAEGGINRAILS